MRYAALWLTLGKPETRYRLDSKLSNYLPGANSIIAVPGWDGVDRSGHYLVAFLFQRPIYRLTTLRSQQVPNCAGQEFHVHSQDSSGLRAVEEGCKD